MTAEREDTFLKFELELVAGRYDQLKERDHQSFVRQAKLFSFLIIYGAGPFLLEAGLDGMLLRIWGLGGIWLGVTVLFYCDRDFRAYGLHLKERVLCVKQLAILRGIMMEDAQRYRAESLLPIGVPVRTSQRFMSFADKLSTKQLRVGSYFYKFLGFFPLLYLALFAAATLRPVSLLEDAGGTFYRVFFMLAPLWVAWLYYTLKHCVDLQLVAFEARRISIYNPWPKCSRAELRKAMEVTPGYAWFRSKLTASWVLAALSSMWFGWRLYYDASIGDFLQTMQQIGVAILVIACALYFVRSDRFLTAALNRLDQEYKAVFSGDPVPASLDETMDIG